MLFSCGQQGAVLRPSVHFDIVLPDVGDVVALPTAVQEQLGAVVDGDELSVIEAEAGVVLGRKKVIDPLHCSLLK